MVHRMGRAVAIRKRKMPMESLRRREASRYQSSVCHHHWRLLAWFSRDGKKERVEKRDGILNVE